MSMGGSKPPHDHEPDLLAIVRSCVVRATLINHSGLLPWHCDLLKTIPMLYFMAGALGIADESGPIAGIELAGYVFALEADGLWTILVRKDGSVYCPGHCDRRGHARPVTLVDDVVTTGASMRNAESALMTHGITVADRVCILDRREEFPERSDRYLEVRSLFKSADLDVRL